MSRILLSALLLLVAAVGCNKSEPTPPEPKQAAAPQPAAMEIDPATLSMFAALPAEFESKDNPITEEKVALGRMLYFDTRLSKNHDLSCNSCHDLAKFGVDGKSVSAGHRGQLGKRNSPTVFNAAGRFSQFWDGRAATVEEQVRGPMFNPVEMAMPAEAKVVSMLKSVPDYGTAFRKAFPADKNPMTTSNVSLAIGAFERKLVTPAPWDRYLAGEKTALTAEQKAGVLKFVEAGCTSCHGGALIGGTMFQKLGLVKPWPNTKDSGRYEVTQKEEDRMMFVVPGLRNVTKTGPYFHDGSVASLEKAVRDMAEYQFNRQLSDGRVAGIVSWLGSLTGTPPAALIAVPGLPASGPKTPRPDPS